MFYGLSITVCLLTIKRKKNRLEVGISYLHKIIQRGLLDNKSLLCRYLGTYLLTYVPVIFFFVLVFIGLTGTDLLRYVATIAPLDLSMFMTHLTDLPNYLYSVISQVVSIPAYTVSESLTYRRMFLPTYLAILCALPTFLLIRVGNQTLYTSLVRPSVILRKSRIYSKNHVTIRFYEMFALVTFTKENKILRLLKMNCRAYDNLCIAILRQVCHLLLTRNKKRAQFRIKYQLTPSSDEQK